MTSMLTAARLTVPALLAAAWLAAPAAGQQLAAADRPAGESAPVTSGDWASDPVWFDGLVERATYDASRVVYGEPRPYEATFLTNKERHDAASLTKDGDGEGATVEVWKHNQIEVVPTPNYDYKYEATSHLTTGGEKPLLLTRLDVASQEFCGATFKQYLLTDGLPLSPDAADAAKPGEARNPQANRPAWSYFGFSYMPDSGRVAKVVTAEPGGPPVVAFNALPLSLRSFDFAAKGTTDVLLLPDQKSNKSTTPDTAPAQVRYAGEGDGTHKLELVQDGKTIGTYEMAADRLHVMVAYDGADGQTYRLKSVERDDYWSTNGK